MGFSSSELKLVSFDKCFRSTHDVAESHINDDDTKRGQLNRFLYGGNKPCYGILPPNPLFTTSDYLALDLFPNPRLLPPPFYSGL